MISATSVNRSTRLSIALARAARSACSIRSDCPARSARSLPARRSAAVSTISTTRPRRCRRRRPPGVADEEIGTSSPSPRRHLSSSPRAERLSASAHSSGQRSRGTRAPPGSRWHRVVRGTRRHHPSHQRRGHGRHRGAPPLRSRQRLPPPARWLNRRSLSRASPMDALLNAAHLRGPLPSPPPTPECLPRCATGAQSKPRPVVRTAPGGGDALGRRDQDVFFRLRLMHSERTAVRADTGDPRTDSEDGSAEPGRHPAS